MPKAPGERIFFALWPPPAAARAIDERARAAGVAGRRVAIERSHLTLAFHGQCDRAAIAGLERAATGLALPAFGLTLDRVGYFRRSGVVWLGPSITPEPLNELAMRLAPVSGSAYRRFTPHVTVARKAPPVAVGAITPIIWPVTGFLLVASGAQGIPGAYRELACWRLADGAVSGPRL